MAAIDYSLSINEPGQFVTGIEDIAQSIAVIIGTRKGTVPYQPTFGCDWFDYFDQPVNVSAPAMSSAILSAVATWEPRAAINSITYVIDNELGHIAFTIGYEVPDTADTGEVIISTGTFTQPVAAAPVPYQFLTTTAGEILTTEADEDLIL